MPTVKFKTALVANSPLNASTVAHLGAVADAHKKLIADDQKKRVLESLNLDDATRAAFPQENRWDYLFSIKEVGVIVGVEPHSAGDGEVKVVVAKKKQASAFLENHLVPKHRVAAWIWVASGPVYFSRTEKVTRVLAQNGIRFAGKVIRSFD